MSATECRVCGTGYPAPDHDCAPYVADLRAELDRYFELACGAVPFMVKAAEQASALGRTDIERRVRKWIEEFGK